MKKFSVLILVLLLGACDDAPSEESETDNKDEAVSTEVPSNNELAELEEENEALRKELAEKENKKLRAELENDEEETKPETEPEVENEEIEEVSSIEEETAEIGVQEFSLEEQQEMTQAFYNWAVERAKIGGMAVTTTYFNHGAAGRGDWYAMTPDGEIQTQNQDNPGFDHFDIHAIGGVAFYQPASGNFGTDENAAVPSTAAGYSELALPDTNINKYMLADNGVVYELIGKKENMSFSSGFGEYADDGTRGEYSPGIPFEVSGDQDAQQEWQRILGMYQR